MQVKTTALAVCTLQFIIAIPVAGQAEGRFTVGLGVSTSSGFYESEDADLSLLPFLSYQNRNLSLGFDGVRYRVQTSDRLTFAFGVTPRAEPDFPETALFNGLDRDTTAEGLISATYTLQATSHLTLSAQHDLLSEHSGYEVTLSYGRTHVTTPLQLDTQVGLRHRSDDLNDYLVGVAPSEATNTRAAFSAGATTSPFVGLTATLPVTDKSAVIGIVTMDYFGNAYKDSPLVDRRFAASLSIGLAYSF